ncbi:hypothetical protein LguiA_036447 [Lonicera macranthoides]
MKAEYFPPREDVILQNEAPTDLYILVTGAVDLVQRKNGTDHVVGELTNGDVCGEIGVLCYRPQLFTVRTKRLSQLLRLNRSSFFNILQANVGDGTIIMNNLLQHLKDRKDPTMDAILADTEEMLAKGRMDLPLSLCFAAIRGDDLLLKQLLKKGVDPNEFDNNGRTPLHIAASKGSVECAVLLLGFGADPNIKDYEGNVPLWDAIVGKHESMIKLLTENGATISSGNVGQFACFAVEQNNIDLLKELVRFGGDVTQVSTSGTTALHSAISHENTEMVKFLVGRGADIDKPDMHGWTPRALADYQGHEDIKSLFKTKQEGAAKTELDTVSPKQREAPYLKKNNSVPTLPPSWQDARPSTYSEPTSAGSRGRRRAHHFNNSLFGIVSAAQRLDRGGSGSPLGSISEYSAGNLRTRVTISCPEKGEVTGKLVILPESLQELLEIGAGKFGFSPTKVLTKDGALIEDITVIRDGDHLVLAS